MSYDPIRKNMYIDPYRKEFSTNKKIQVYNLFLYKNLSKGSFPVYKLTCSNKPLLIQLKNIMMKKYNLKSTHSIVYFDVDEENKSLYEQPQILDLSTGEILDNSDI